MVMDGKLDALNMRNIVGTLRMQIAKAEHVVMTMHRMIEEHIPDSVNKFKILEEFMIWSQATWESPKEDSRGVLESKAVQSLDKAVGGKAYRMWNMKFMHWSKQGNMQGRY